MFDDVIRGHDIGYTDAHTNKPPTAGVQIVVHTSIIAIPAIQRERKREIARERWKERGERERGRG